MANISINIIESSSKGNCILLNDGHTSLFLDFGSNHINIQNSLNLNGISKQTIIGALITHEHIDHIRAIESETFKNIPFYLTNGTYSLLKHLTRDFRIIKFNKWYKMSNSNWKFKAFPTLHNALEPACFLIKNKNKSFLYLTDTKYFVNKKFKGCTCYIIESNFGCEFIDNKIKLNIHNNFEIRNHLNLEENEKLFNRYKTRKTKLFLLSHLSSKFIKCELIDLVVDRLQKKNPTIQINYINPNKINYYKWE
ncbi:MAG: hypothetical protein K2I36_00070, partial [Ureaplasma sp.]|nr:hypothetical protein [Ureaplasma sp.]